MSSLIQWPWHSLPDNFTWMTVTSYAQHSGEASFYLFIFSFTGVRSCGVTCHLHLALMVDCLWTPATVVPKDDLIHTDLKILFRLDRGQNAVDFSLGYNYEIWIFLILVISNCNSTNTFHHCSLFTEVYHKMGFVPPPPLFCAETAQSWGF